MRHRRANARMVITLETLTVVCTCNNGHIFPGPWPCAGVVPGFPRQEPFATYRFSDSSLVNEFTVRPLGWGEGEDSATFVENKKISTKPNWVPSGLSIVRVHSLRRSSLPRNPATNWKKTNKTPYARRINVFRFSVKRRMYWFFKRNRM